MNFVYELFYAYVKQQGMCFNRGFTAAADFVEADLTEDNAWHDLDLSNIVPEDTRCVHLRVTLKSDTNQSNLRIRNKDYGAGFNVFQVITPDANEFADQHGMISVDSDRKAEYKASVAVWDTLNITVTGWSY